MTKNTKDTKFIVIGSRNIHHEGDERSKQYPGHGYPAWTEEVPTIGYYNTEQDLKDTLAILDVSKVRVFSVKELSVEIKKTVSIDIGT